MYVNQNAANKTEFAEKGGKLKGGLGKGGRVVTNLSYADDTTLIAHRNRGESKENKRESGRLRLYLNVLKTKVMITRNIEDDM